MDIRISPSKLGNRYVLGRAGKDIRNVTGSFRIDDFAKGIISKYEKPDIMDLPRTEMALLKRPELPQSLSDIQEIINELLIINKSHTDVENALFRNISIENSILRCNMLFSRLEAGNEYKDIREELENIYRLQVQSPEAEKARDNTKPQEIREILTEKQLTSQIETILEKGGLQREMVERIMSPVQKEMYTEREELIRQPEYIPMNTTPLGQWKSPEAKNFFWRVQRLEHEDRELVLKSLGNISLSKLETILKEMDSNTWYSYSSSIADRIRIYMESPEAEAESGAALLTPTAAAENYYSQLLEMIESEEELTPELLLEEKENLIKFLEREDTSSERVREEVIRILNGIHKTVVLAPSIPDKKTSGQYESGSGTEDVTAKALISEEGRSQEAAKVQRSEEETERELVRKRVIARVTEDIEAMGATEFSALYERIRENAADMPKDVLETLIPTLRVEGTEVNEQEIEIDRHTVLSFLKKTQTQEGYYSELLLDDIVRADEHRIRNYRRASEIAETTMNLSTSEWYRFTRELRELSEKSELSRRYIEASREAEEAAQNADGEVPGLEGAGKARKISPEMREQVESSREKMIFITQLDKAFKEGVDIYNEGDILTENSIFSNYVYRRDRAQEDTEIPGIQDRKTRALVEYLTKENMITLTESISRKSREYEEREELIRKEVLLTQRENREHTSRIDTILEERELIHPDLRVRRIRSSMEPMLEEIRSEGLENAAAAAQALSYIERRREDRTAQAITDEVPAAAAPVTLVTVKKPEAATREEIEEIKKTAAQTQKQLQENTTDIKYIKGDRERTEVTREHTVDMKSLYEKFTVQENEIEKIKAMQEKLIREGKSDSYYTQKTITKVNDQLRMERMRRGL